jgi:hypothetical protein
MMGIVRLIVIYWFVFTTQNCFSQKIDFGLISQIELQNFKAVSHPSNEDLDLHNSIDAKAKTNSYLSKICIGKEAKIQISIHTNSTINDYLKPIKKSKQNYPNLKFWIYKKVHFVSLELSVKNKIINRIIYQEPNLTTIVILDYIQDLPTSKLISKQIISSISFRTST